VGQFASCLAERLAEPAPTPAAEEQPQQWEEPEPLDLLRTAGLPVAKRAAGLVAALALLTWVAARLLRRVRGRHTS
jgi:hypothetical protein